MSNYLSSVSIKDQTESIPIENCNNNNLNNSNINNNEVKDQNNFSLIIGSADKVEVEISSSSDTVLNLIGIEKLFEKYKCFYKDIKHLILSKEEEKKCENYDCEKQLNNEMKYIIKKINNLTSGFKKKKIIWEQRFFIKAEIKNNNDNLYEEANLYKNFIKENYKKQANKIENENENKNKIKKNIVNINNINIKEYNIKLKKNIKNENNILPGLISPMGKYNIFMHCVKKFEYEKKIFDSYLNLVDYLALKSFIPIIDNYLTQTFSSYSKKVCKTERKIKKNTFGFK